MRKRTSTLAVLRGNHSGRFARRRLRRRGVLLVAALICLLLVSALSGSLIRHSLLHYREVRNVHRDCQANLLAVAASDRARAQLAADENYQGETWEVRLDVLQEPQDARAVIRVVPAGETAPRSVHVQVTLPLDSSTPVFLEHHFSLPAMPQGESE